MLSSSTRFSRSSFPRKRPQKRMTYPWGSVAIYHVKPPQAVVVVSKKTLKKAHNRNKVRRRVYGALSEIFKEKTATKSAIVFPRREALTTPYKMLVDDLQSALT